MDVKLSMQNNVFNAGLHVAIIMDGNGRWANARGQLRTAGHRAGSHAVRRTITAAPKFNISTLTLYAFSSDNWQRPAAEVRALMELFERYLAMEAQRCVKNGVRLSVIGRRDRLNPRLVKAIEKAEAKTAHCSRLHLRVAVDYSGRASIIAAAQKLTAEQQQECDFASFGQTINQILNSHPPAPDVDLLIRTGGEKRLSDFMLWECAYAELYFIDTYWPDFSEEELGEAVADFQNRDRRFGTAQEAAL